MTSRVESSFQRVLSRSPDKLGFSTISLLAWMAVSDRRITDEEHVTLRDIAEMQRNLGELDLALDVARQANEDDLFLACEMVRNQPHNGRHQFITWAISVVVADGRITIAENCILRFFADLTNIDLGEIYGAVTRSILPLPGDPSSVEWWNMYEEVTTQESARSASSQWQSATDEMNARRRKTRISRHQALAILGLDEKATATEIQNAFRQLANIHHPDRFWQAGPEAQRAASKRFFRIREAFESLKL